MLWLEANRVMMNSACFKSRRVSSIPRKDVRLDRPRVSHKKHHVVRHVWPVHVLQEMQVHRGRRQDQRSHEVTVWPYPHVPRGAGKRATRPNLTRPHHDVVHAHHARVDRWECGDHGGAIGEMRRREVLELAAVVWWACLAHGSVVVDAPLSLSVLYMPTVSQKTPTAPRCWIWAMAVANQLVRKCPDAQSTTVEAAAVWLCRDVLGCVRSCVCVVSLWALWPISKGTLSGFFQEKKVILGCSRIYLINEQFVNTEQSVHDFMNS